MTEKLRVKSVCVYCTSDITKGDDPGFSALKFVKKIKGEAFKGYGTVPVGKRRFRIDKDTSDKLVFAWCAEMTADCFSSRPSLLVPVPSSWCSSKSEVRKSRPFKLAEAIANRHWRREAEALLWWQAPIESAHNGDGSRDPAVLGPLLVKPVKGDKSVQVILIDDVYTTGGHLLACEWRLRSQGYRVVGAVCAARTTDNTRGAFATREVALARVEL
jgi:predicted amidophosphoribosyltransferase